jgi:hypothetical protein
VFAQASSRLTAFSYIGALLAEYVWDWKAALAALQRFIVAQLGRPGGDRTVRFPGLLPKAWCVGQARREKAYVPEEAAFTTKPALGTQMITGADDGDVQLGAQDRHSAILGASLSRAAGWPAAVHRSAPAAAAAGPG